MRIYPLRTIHFCTKFVSVHEILRYFRISYLAEAKLKMNMIQRLKRFTWSFLMLPKKTPSVTEAGDSEEEEEEDPVLLGA